MINGYCHCRKTSYQLSGEVLTCYVCHCTACQRSSGSAFSTNMLVSRSHLTLLSGCTGTNEYQFGDRFLNRQHCLDCGTALWLNYADQAEFVSVQSGTLEDQAWFEPIAHLWISKKRPWVSIPAHSNTYKTQPDFSDLIRLWKKSGYVAPG